MDFGMQQRSHCRNSCDLASSAPKLGREEMRGSIAAGRASAMRLALAPDNWAG